MASMLRKLQKRINAHSDEYRERLRTRPMVLFPKMTLKKPSRLFAYEFDPEIDTTGLVLNS